MVDDTKEFTLMFYFASDNPLAISVVSQLKAIKAAGFHKEANVIVQFDPFTEGTPTHIFDVNMINKINAKCDCQTTFDDKQPFVLNLIDDKLWNGERTREGKFVRKATAEFIEGYDPPHPPNGLETINGEHHEFGPQRSLDRFLEFCSYAYPAKHYLLFILGHGVVVGNDVFLFDENADEHSLKLGTLGNVLRKFSDDVKLGGGSFDLLGFHSCSVGSLEVAYELQDTAKYMLASQGTAFVGSWPYSQMLRRVFDSLEEKTPVNEKTMREMLVDLFFFCMHNSTDFLLAGYPFDLTLFDLGNISSTRGPLEKLSSALIEGLNDDNCLDLIILAHWKSQSFYQEMYTDIFDFCFCLKKKLEQHQPTGKAAPNLLNACTDMMSALAKEWSKGQDGGDEKFIVCSEFAGPEYQYAHGISVYFPWSKPPADRRILEEYSEYKFTGEDFETNWLDFLEAYWQATLREPSRVELNRPALDRAQALYEDKISLVYAQEGPRDPQNALSRMKTDPTDPTGGDELPISIKNYPRDIRDRRELKRAGASVTLSETFLPKAAP
jgi:Clostripain family